jgi:hypothetical protein
VGVGKVAGRLPKLGERKRRTQFEAPGGLPPRNGDGGLERLLGDRQVGRVTLQQHFAADAMKFRFEGAMTSPFARRQRLIEDRDRTVDVACVGFGFGNRNLDKPVEVQNVLLAQEVGAATHVGDPADEFAAFHLRHALENDPKRSPQRQIVFARKSSEFDGVSRCPREVAAHQFDQGDNAMSRSARADVRVTRDPRLSVTNEGNCALNVAQRPQREREVKHRRDARVLSETKGQIVVPAGLEQRQRAFQMLACYDVLSSEPMRDSRRPVSDSGLGRIGPRLDVAEEGLGVGPRRRQLAPHQTTHPKAVVGRQPLWRVLVANCERASSCEGFGRLRRPIAARAMRALP